MLINIFSQLLNGDLHEGPMNRNYLWHE